MKLIQTIFFAALCGATLFGCKKDDGRIPLTTKSKAARAHYKAAQTHLECMRLDSARHEFAEAVKADSEFAMAYLGLSMTQPVSGQMYMKATAAEAISRPEIEARSQQARVGLVLPILGGSDSPELFDQAARRVDRVSSGERLMILAQRARTEDNRTAEQAHLKQLVEQYPNDEQAHEHLADYYMRSFDFSGAVEEYQKAIRCKPDSPVSYNLLGYCYVKLEQYEAAARAFERYIELLPHESNPYDSYAELLLSMSRHEESLDNYRKAIALDSSFLNPRLGAAVNLLYLGRPDEAKQMLQLPLAGGKVASPKEQYALLYMGATVALAKKDTVSALAQLRERALIAQADTYAVWEMFDAWDLLGSVYGQLGMPDSAAACLKRCLWIAQFNGIPPMIRALLETIYHGKTVLWVSLVRNDLDDAAAHLGEMEKNVQGMSNPEVAHLAHLARGRIALARGRAAEAVEELKRGQQKDPLVQYYLGLAYGANQDPTEAQNQFAKALKTRSLKCLMYKLIEPYLRAATTRAG